MTPRASANRLLLLGKDFPSFDDLAIASQADGRTALAISAGSDRCRQRKGTQPVPNEDACLALDQGPRTLIAVADAHFGFESSHELLRALAQLDRVPHDLAALKDAVRELALPGPAPHDSETTLAVAVLDRDTGTGFGMSFGDSSLVVFDGGGARLLNRKTHRYVSPWDAGSLAPRHGRTVSFELRPGELLLAFTDGVDECHYGRPATSVRTKHIGGLFGGYGANATTMVEALGHLAMAGVDGNPGGEDNLALVATAV